GFWSTLDADSAVDGGKKEEGAFYVWTPQQVVAVLGPADGALFNRVYDITDGGNFEGHSIPNLLEKPLDARAKELKLAPEALRARLDGMRAKLLAARAKRPRPSLDDKILANWNGLMIRAFALGFDATGDERYRKAAVDAATFVLATMRGESVKLGAGAASAPRRLAHSYRAGRVQPQAFLEDYSYMIAGLLELHRVTREARWLDEARSLNLVLDADFWDEAAGRYYSTPHHHEALVARATSAEDGATPSGQSMAAWSLIHLGRATGDNAIRDRGARVLNTYAQELKRYPDAVPNMLLAAYAHFDPTAGAPSEATADKPVTVTLDAAPKGVRPGEELTLNVRLAIRSGWHVGAAGADSVTPTTVELAPGPFQIVSRIFPTPKALKVAFSAKPQKVFEGQVVIPIKIKALLGAEKATEIRVRVRYQACNNQVCDRPTEVTLSAPLTPK
ncbi:MAG: protein-disulfide reductase DsbD domain-containing protein, partial [Actinomycetota bacterium]